MTLTGSTDADPIVPRDGHRGWVNYLAVDPAERGKGLGRQLMVEIESKLRAMGCPKLSLQVRTGNDDAIAFYRALGYEVDAAASLGKRLIAEGCHESRNCRRASTVH